MAVIVLLGDINIDVVLDISEYPAEGGEAIASSQTMALGGSATNTAIALARCGHECRLIGRVGDDAWGRHSIADLEAIGVVTRWIGVDEKEPTQLNVVTVGAGGERTMFAYRGANTRLSADSVGEAAFVSADLFHLSGYALLAQPQRDAALHAIDLAAARGIPISLDLPGGIVATITADVRRLLPQLDTVVLDRSDLPHLFNQASNACGRSPVEAMLHARVRRVAMKGEGAQSSLYQMNSVDCAPWFEVEVEDTTGAGDAFAAGHIHGRVAGWTGRDCCRLANAFGALTVTRRGAGRAMPALSEVMALMQATESER